ncbi:hypothetical protein FAF40_01320 [Staphylococcus haemolyticus]|uniref:hypothetical protein n=1 Tax=Staphylococcus haemolyticus TaxID=1283 RepID=UPI0010AC9C3E|nr:hypothetical protein [Staphylococcus haemolyticus]TJX73986.1 hypothetical protein FAF40_01320 [Staphylococcus haemolyticus]
MSRYTDLVNEIGEEKLNLVFDEANRDIASECSFEALKDALHQVIDDEDLSHLDVVPNDDDFFENINFTKKDVAFSAVMGDYNPHDDYVIIDGRGNFTSYDEYKYQELIRESGGEIMRIYLPKLQNGQVEFVDGLDEAVKLVASEFATASDKYTLED